MGSWQTEHQNASEHPEQSELAKRKVLLPQLPNQDDESI